MQRIARLLPLALMMMVVAACNGGIAGSGTPKSETRKLDAFSSLSADGAYQIHVKPGAATSEVTLEGDDNLLPLIVTKIENGTLAIRSEQRFSSSKPIALTISTPSLEELHLAGAVALDMKGITGDSLMANASGACSLVLEGQVKKFEVTTSGAGKVAAGGLHAETVTVTLSGAGSVEVFATDQLNATISGAGSVAYGGHPKNIQKQISGVGQIRPL